MASTVLITGASRGLGFEFTKQYADDGWRVFATCRDPAAADNLNRLGEASGGLVRVLALDVVDIDTIVKAAADLDGEAIDILLNCAGIVGPEGQKPGNIDYSAWAEAFDVNVMGPTRVTEAFVEHLGRSQRKTVVTISSGMGSMADNTSGGSLVYRTTKAAVNMVVRNLAHDLAPRGICSVAVNPGWVRTDMGGPNATQSPEESVGALRRLIASLTPEHTGTFLNYDGAEYAW